MHFDKVLPEEIRYMCHYFNYMNNKSKRPLTADEVMRIRNCIIEYTKRRLKHGPKFTRYERAGLVYLAQALGIGKPAHPASLTSLKDNIEQLRNRMWRTAHE